MILVEYYGRKIRAALTAAINTTKLAEAWSALRPGALKAADPLTVQFLAAAREAITAALRPLLLDVWTEGWVLGQLSAQAVTNAAQAAKAPIWRNWEPGDVDAAQLIANGGLQQLLQQAGITLAGIAATQVNQIGAALSAALEHGDSVDTLAAELDQLLGDPAAADLIAQTELARANTAAALDVYGQAQVGQVDVSTAGDGRVCAVCEDAEAAGPYMLTDVPGVPFHPRCRCMVVPVADSIATSVIGDLVGVG